MSSLQSFSSSYGEARSKFLRAADAAGAAQRHFLNDRAWGAAGEPLYTDVARLGPAGASRVLILNSATHGVEGYCGSACQVAAIADGILADLPDDCAAVLSHALNPYGFAHDRRVNEDNVDLNRNFVDHGALPQDPPDYELLHPWIVPGDWEGEERERADAMIARYRADLGMAAYQYNVMAGQYRFPDGLFFGGRQATWSNLAWRRIIAEQCAGAAKVAFIDFHTGLGPSGVGEAIFIGAEDKTLDRAADWYGEVTSTAKGTSSSAQVRGDLARAFDELPADVEVTPIALEFGTVPLLDMMEAVRADNWLYARGDPRGRQSAAIKQQIRAAFYVESDIWKSAVLARAADVVRRALKGLGNG